MAIEKIIDVMTMDNAPWLDGATILLYPSQRYKGAFIWGIEYIGNKGRQSEVKVELVYEVRNTNGIYLIEPFHGKAELIGQDLEMYGKDEYRLVNPIDSTGNINFTRCS